MRGEDGFSLVEMLVVVAIVSVLSVSATLPFAQSGHSARDDGAALAAEAARLWTLAILSDQAHAIVLSETGWVVERHNGQGWSRVGVPVVFGSVRAALPTDAPARIVMLPDGRTSTAEIRLEARREAIVCRTDGGGPLTCAAG